MPFEFRLPDIGEGIAEGEVVEWFVREGGDIREDAPLVSVLTDKANVEIPSPKSGKVVKIHAQVGEKVKVGGILVTIEESGSSGAKVPSPAAAVPTPAAPPVAGAPAGGPSPAPSTSPRPVVVDRVLATPYVRRLAAEKGVDLAKLVGSGPGGRITEADVTGAKVGSVPATAPKTAPPATSAAPAAPAAGGTFEAVPIHGVRRVISERMSASVHTAAHFTYVEEVEVSELIRLRDRMAKHTEKNGTKLSYLPFLIKAVIAGLRAHPWMNARMDDAKGELHVYPSYHLGIATATEQGLMVPVIRSAEKKSLNDLAREIQALSEKAREGKLTLPELTGGTFTITSLGALGGILATPILNYPEVAILGVHKIQHRPTYLPDGSIGPGNLMNLSVSLDHRILDGIVGAQFLAVVKSHLEDPHSLFADAV